MDLFTNTGMDYVKAFRHLTPYDVDFNCEKIYLAMEQFLHNKGWTKPLPFTLPEYRYIHMQGMRTYFLEMISAQKNSFDHYIEAMRASSYMAERELTPEEIERHHQMFSNLADDIRGRKRSAATAMHGLRGSGRRKKAA